MFFGTLHGIIEEYEYIIIIGPKRIGKSLLPLNKPLNQKQWDELENLRIELEEEYKLRRSMLLTRLDVTVQSFQVCILEING